MGKESWATTPKSIYGTSRTCRDQCSNCMFVYEKRGAMIPKGSTYEYDYSTHYCKFYPPGDNGFRVVKPGQICGQYVENESEKYSEKVAKTNLERIYQEQKEKERKEERRQTKSIKKPQTNDLSEKKIENDFPVEQTEVKEPIKQEPINSSYVAAPKNQLGPTFCWDSYFNISSSFDEALHVNNVFLRCIAVFFSCIIVPVNVAFIAAVTITLSLLGVNFVILSILFLIGIFTPIPVSIDLTDIGLEQYIFNK